MLASIITAESPQKKISLFRTFYKTYLETKTLSCVDDPLLFETPSYAPFCSILRGAQTHHRKNLEDPYALGAFLHAIVHIEYCAIDLALDAVYRFGKISPEFVADWLEVADDEVRHFEMLSSLLGKLGYRYGDFPVHAILFDAMNKTHTSLALRMALIPKTYEANGLDANLKMSDRVRRLSHPLKEEILKALNIIRIEEIDHVAKGNRWFEVACHAEGRNPKDFLEMVASVSQDAAKKRSFLNIADRKKAGFTCHELRNLSLKELNCDDK